MAEESAGVELPKEVSYCRRPHALPRFSMSQISTLRGELRGRPRRVRVRRARRDRRSGSSSCPQDGDDGEALEAFERSGLESASAVPLVPSILPLPRLGGPTDPAERIDAFCASIHRLAPFRPGGIVCLTGSGARPRSRRRARRSSPTGCARSPPRRSWPASRSRSSRTSATAARSGRSRPRSPRRSS